MRDSGAAGAAGAAGALGAAGAVRTEGQGFSPGLSAVESRPVQIPSRLLILAPSWLGDAVMALPLLADLHRAWPETRLTIAARKSVAPLYAMVPHVAETIVLETRGARAAVGASRGDVERLAAGSFDAALLLPNSFISAWLVWRAGIPQRWGFARDLRGALLTRPVPRLRRYGHQVEYYQALGTALGIPRGPAHARVIVPAASDEQARRVLEERGAGDRPFAVFAPGAAYGRAKQWPPAHFAQLARDLATDGIATVLVGAAGDAPACHEIAEASDAIDVAGRTDLPTLAALLARARAVVANDSGAMHLAGAVGARVIAIFGPTDDHKTSPLRATEDAPAPQIVATSVWCRPCMLRECPIDHRCMTRISASQVRSAL